MINLQTVCGFSFSHELGHFFLHKELYIKFGISSPEDWKDFILNVPENEYRSFEWQANEFAGRLLVPYPELETEMEKVGEILKENNLIPFLKMDPDAVLIKNFSDVMQTLWSFDGSCRKKGEKRRVMAPEGVRRPKSLSEF